MFVNRAHCNLGMLSDIFDSHRLPLDRQDLLGGAQESHAIPHDIGSFTPLIWGDGLFGSS
jgi:hypothetical protein